jgi:hypothetical protein
MRTTLALIVAGLLAAGPAFAQGTAGGTPNTGPQGTGNFVSGKPGDPANPNTGRSGANTGPATSNPSATSSGDMGGTNSTKAPK